MTTKNFGISAVGRDLQYGKQGGRIVFDDVNGLFKITAADGATVTRIKVADAVDNDDSVSLGQVNGLISTAVQNGVQVELDDTQTGAGLESDGSYLAETLWVAVTNETGAHYIHAATSLKDADKILDSQIKQVADDLAALGSGSITDIQDELDLTQVGAGLDAAGNYVALTGSNYLTGATSIHNATSLLDAQVKVNADAIATADGEIGDLTTLTTTEKGSLVGAINELDADLAGLGTMSAQDADAVAITGGAIDGVVIGGTTAANGTFADVTINGNLTVTGTTTTLDVTNLAVSDNTIILNDGEAGPGVTSGTSGIEIDRGATTGNARWIWDETTDSWAAQVYNTTNTSWEAATISGNFSGSAVDFGFANTSLVRGDSTELAMGSEYQVLTVGATDVSYSYVDAVRDATGAVVIGQGTLNGTGGEYLEFAHEADAVYLTARNSAGTGDVDLYLAGQGNGDVIISQNASQQGLVIAEDDTTLTISGGNAAAGDAGDAILKGGDGTGAFASGDVVLQGGTGGASEGITIIKDSAGNEVAGFAAGIAAATDYVEVTNGIGDATISAVGDSTDVDLVLAPKGAGAVVVPAGYDISTAGAEAVVNKGYLDSQIGEVANNVDPLIIRNTVTADSTNSTINIGTMSNVAGKTYYVSRITLHVTTDFVGASLDHMVVSDGTTELAEEADSDVVAGTYVIDLPFAVATAGGASIDVNFLQADGTTAAVPTAGSMIAVVEYKVL